MIWNILGAANLQLNQNENAAEALNNVIELNPNYEIGFNNLGIALKEQFKFDEAIQAFKKCISLQPDYAIAYNNLGNTLKEQGKLDDAVEAYNKCIVLDPTYAEADIKDFVDDDYVAGHQNYFESMFAINSIHFFPLKHIREKINRIVTMIKPGGRCFMTLNMRRMIERDPDTVYDDLESFVRKQLHQMDFEYEVFDVNLKETLNEYLDGNVRMVCHRI